MTNLNGKQVLFILVLMIIVIGFVPTVKILLDIVILVNSVFYELASESVLSILFKHRITYYIVGLVLSSITSVVGVKLSGIFGKILYAVTIVGAIAVLNFLMMIIIYLFQ